MKVNLSCKAITSFDIISNKITRQMTPEAQTRSQLFQMIYFLFETPLDLSGNSIRNLLWFNIL